MNVCCIHHLRRRVSYHPVLDPEPASLLGQLYHLGSRFRLCLGGLRLITWSSSSSDDERKTEELKGAVDRLNRPDAWVSRDTLALLLRQCDNAESLYEGKRVHAHIASAGYQGHTYIGNLLVQMYGKCGSMDDARLVFDGIQKPNVFSWTLMLAAYVQNGFLEDARSMFDKMPQTNVVSWNSMVGAYARSRHLADAKSLFDDIPERDVVSWNNMITAYAQNGHPQEALEIFQRMEAEAVRPNKVTFLSLIDACSSLPALAEGKMFHAAIIKCGLHSDTKLNNALVDMYGKCGSLEEAKKVFDKMPEKDVVSWTAMLATYAKNGYVIEARDIFAEMPIETVVPWNAMISAYSQNGFEGEALGLYQVMDLEGVKRNNITFITALNACARLSALKQGKAIHLSVICCGYETDMLVGTALINMYGKCKRLEDAQRAFSSISRQDVVSWTALVVAYAQNGHLQDARGIFEKMAHRNVVSWNAMIAAYAQNGHGKEALEVFHAMDVEGIKPDEATFISALEACIGLGALEDGRRIHAKIVSCGLSTDVVLGTALVELYGRCSCLEDARSVFDRLPHRDVVSWTTMITAYAQSSLGKEALKLLRAMDVEGVKADEIIFASVVDGCASIGALECGKAIHCRVVSHGFDKDVVLGTALINLYGRCGSLNAAQQVFGRIPQRDAAMFNSMMASYSQNGFGKEALELFPMMGLEGIQPNEITFVSILSACSHHGLLYVGRNYFLSLTGDFYDVGVCVEHYACMVDILARAGRLVEAAELLNSMPFEPDVVAWTMLLGASGLDGDIRRAASAAEEALELDPKDTAPYVLLSNIYSSAGKLAP